MKWTKEPPKLNGFYPRDGMKPELVTIVEIDNNSSEYGSAYPDDK